MVDAALCPKGDNPPLWIDDDPNSVTVLSMRPPDAEIFFSEGKKDWFLAYAAA